MAALLSWMTRAIAQQGVQRMLGTAQAHVSAQAKTVALAVSRYRLPGAKEGRFMAGGSWH